MITKYEYMPECSLHLSADRKLIVNEFIAKLTNTCKHTQRIIILNCEFSCVDPQYLFHKKSGDFEISFCSVFEENQNIYGFSVKCHSKFCSSSRTCTAISNILFRAVEYDKF